MDFFPKTSAITSTPNFLSGAPGIQNVDNNLQAMLQNISLEEYLVAVEKVRNDQLIELRGNGFTILSSIPVADNKLFIPGEDDEESSSDEEDDEEETLQEAGLVSAQSTLTGVPAQAQGAAAAVENEVDPNLVAQLSKLFKDAAAKQDEDEVSDDQSDALTRQSGSRRTSTETTVSDVQ